MPPLAELLRDPLPLAPNRVARFYRGGRMLDELRGAPEPMDDDRPEDWVGSATPTWTPPGSKPPSMGVSEIELDGRRIGMDALLRAEPEALVGRALLQAAGPTLGLLVKLLDAGERLPMHCHPTRDAARRLLGSRFGKTEAWVILAVRDEDQPASVWAGFREPVDRSLLRDWIDRGDSPALLDALAEWPVLPGDVILIPAGVPHAIGPGVFLLELQEPTDFSVVAETRGFPIDDDDASLHLGWDDAIEFFRLDAPGDPYQAPARTTDVTGLRLTPLLGPAADPFFRAIRLELTPGTHSLPLGPTFVIGVVLAGTGTLRGASRDLAVRRGVTFALPAAAMADLRVEADEPLEVIACLPPDPEALARDLGSSA